MTSRRDAGSLARADPEVARALAGERTRQEDFVELIASENYVSGAVLEALGSTLTNKYADGYPGRRAYRGCEWVDVAESLAVERACRLFGAGYANVQPYSGSIANLAVLHALMKPGDRLLGMDGAQGGHVTHGGAGHLSGAIYDAARYGVAAESGLIDYDRVEDVALEHRPHVIVAGISAYSRVVDWAAFRAIADRVGARLVADIAHVAGLIAAGLYPSPVGLADAVTTTTHKTLRGPRGGMILAAEKGVEPILPSRREVDDPPARAATAGTPLVARVSVKEELEKTGSTPFLRASAKQQLKKTGSTPFLDAAVWPGLQGGPLMHVVAAKAVALGEALLPEFADYQRRVVANARRLADHLAGRGLTIVTGGTDNHMLLVDLSRARVEARAAEAALEAARIAVNAVRVPRADGVPEAPNGLRLGTAAVTTRGFGAPEIERVGDLVADVLEAPDDAAVRERVRAEAAELCARFPVYGTAGEASGAA